MHENQIVQRLLRTGLHHKQYMNEVGCCLNNRQWRLLAMVLTWHLSICETAANSTSCVWQPIWHLNVSCDDFHHMCVKLCSSSRHHSLTNRRDEQTWSQCCLDALAHQSTLACR